LPCKNGIRPTRSLPPSQPSKRRFEARTDTSSSFALAFHYLRHKRRHRCQLGIAIYSCSPAMATFLPRSQISQPRQDLPPGSPPDQAMFHMHHVPQDPPSNPFRPQHRTTADYRANGTPVFANGDGPLPMPPGPHARVANGGPRHRATVSGPVFDGPRSPPNTKRTFTRFSEDTDIEC